MKSIKEFAEGMVKEVYHNLMAWEMVRSRVVKKFKERYSIEPTEAQVTNTMLKIHARDRARTYPEEKIFIGDFI